MHIFIILLPPTFCRRLFSKTSAQTDESYWRLFLAFLPILAVFGLWEFSPVLAGAPGGDTPVLDQSRVPQPNKNFVKFCMQLLENSVLKGLFILYVILEISYFSTDFI